MRYNAMFLLFIAIFIGYSFIDTKTWNTFLPPSETKNKNSAQVRVGRKGLKAFVEGLLSPW
jgi:hypothetical protein